MSHTEAEKPRPQNDQSKFRDDNGTAETKKGLSLTAPSAITAWDTIEFNPSAASAVLNEGGNDGESATPGTVTFAQGNDGVTGWTVTAVCEPGYSTSAGTNCKVGGVRY
jgi:hypothetical protein